VGKLPLFIIWIGVAHEHQYFVNCLEPLTDIFSQVVDILTYISKRESFDLPATFATTIASQSRQNLREAILALEACKTNKYDHSISLFSFCNVKVLDSSHSISYCTIL